MKYRIHHSIKNPEDLGIARLGNPHTSVAPTSTEHRIDRAEYGRVLAELEGGRFTPLGYIVPVNKNRRKRDAA